jgi:hypothetical protein
MLTIGKHKVTCGSLISPDVDAMLAGERVDILYSDPPWGDGNLAYWQTMNKKMTGAETPQVKHDELYDRIMELVLRHVGGYVFIETGLRWKEYVVQRFLTVGLVNVVSYPLRYTSGAKLMENVLVCGLTNFSHLTQGWTQLNPSPFRGAELVRRVVGSVARPGGIVLDPCCGMGYTARAAVAAGMQFRGNELNQARLDKTIAFLKKSTR